jgi:hypothetical protein
MRGLKSPDDNKKKVLSQCVWSSGSDFLCRARSTRECKMCNQVENRSWKLLITPLSVLQLHVLTTMTFEGFTSSTDRLAASVASWLESASKSWQTENLLLQQPFRRPSTRKESSAGGKRTGSRTWRGRRIGSFWNNDVQVWFFFSRRSAIFHTDLAE